MSMLEVRRAPNVGAREERERIARACEVRAERAIFASGRFFWRDAASFVRNGCPGGPGLPVDWEDAE